MSYDISNQITTVDVNVTGASLSGSDAANYSLASTGSTSAKITQKSLSAALVGSIQKTYDGATDATLTNGNFSITGFVTVSGVSEGTSVTKTLGTYNSRNVLQANNVTTSLQASDFSANAGTTLSNYSLPTQASGTGTIGVRTLVVNYTGQDKVFRYKECRHI